MDSHRDLGGRCVTLTEGLVAAGVSLDQLWVSYQARGGRKTLGQVKAVISGIACSSHDHNLLARCINERLGASRQVPYFTDWTSGEAARRP